MCVTVLHVALSGCLLVNSEDTAQSEVDAQSFGFRWIRCSRGSLVGQISDREAAACQLVNQMLVIVGLGLWQ